MDELELVLPSKELEEKAMNYRQEHINFGEAHINGSHSFIRYDNYDEWLDKVRQGEKAETSHFFVPATTYFSVRKSDGKIIGSIQVRHCLNEGLKKSGGHIGYGIRPTERGKGYGKQQLALAILEAKRLGIPEVMITCNKSNTASAKTAISNGGRLTWEGYNEESGCDIQHYWIDISQGE